MSSKYNDGKDGEKHPCYCAIPSLFLCLSGEMVEMRRSIPDARHSGVFRGIYINIPLSLFLSPIKISGIIWMAYICIYMVIFFVSAGCRKRPTGCWPKMWWTEKNRNIITRNDTTAPTTEKKNKV